MRCTFHALTILLALTFGTPSCANSAWKAPVEDVSVIAWTGSWQSLRAPAVAAPLSDGEVTADLEKAFHVAWSRTGQELRLKVTNMGEAWVGRLAIQFKLSANTRLLTYGYGDIPVPVPLDLAKRGQVVWAWEYGVPSWLLAKDDGGSAGAVFDTGNHHGFFADRYPDGGFVVHVSLDWPKKVGESVESTFRLVDDTSAKKLREERGKRLGLEKIPPLDKTAVAKLHSRGFVRVDRTMWGFATGDNHPFRILGMNTPHLPMLTPIEQEKLLSQAQATGITVTRMLLPDYAYRPLGMVNPEAYRRLLATVERCAAHSIHVIICLEYSGAGQQYNLTIHRTPNWSDLYLLPEMLPCYKDTLARVVKPLQSNPAILAWDVTNEPDIALDPPTPVQLDAWRRWLEKHYKTLEALQSAWERPELASFGDANPPKQEDYDWQRTQQSRDFAAFNGDTVGRAMIERAKLVRAADPHHLITLSAWNPRYLRGLPNAGIFDYWSPHSYEIYFVGPEISDQVAYQVELLRRALMDRPRPVVIEEFGLFEDPKFPEPNRAEHCRQFLEAGARWGAGMMYWYDLTPLVQSVIAKASRQPVPRQKTGPELAFYVPKEEESRVLIYNLYMWRRKWGMALATAQDAGFRVREVRGPIDVPGCTALLLLGDDLTAAEADIVKKMRLPVILTPGANGAATKLPGSQMLPQDRAAQKTFWTLRRSD